MGRKPKKKDLKKVRKHLKFNLERLAKHLGKIVDNSSVKDFSEALFYAALAFASYQHFTTVDQDGNIHRDPMNAIFGPVALRLASTDGLISQGAGVAGLMTLGVAMAGVQLGELPDISSWDAFKEIEQKRAKKGRYAVRI